MDNMYSYIDVLQYVKNAKLDIHKTQIIRELDSILLDNYKLSNHTFILEKATHLYRARVLNDYSRAKKEGVDVDECLNTTGYSEFYSKEPPLGFSPSGRNNIEGASYLYLSDSLELACAEVKAIPDDIISIAEFIVKESLNLFDFTVETSNDAINMVTAMYKKPARNSEDYISSQVISDYLNKFGFDGVKYGSHFTSGYNITLFRTHSKNITFKESRLLMYRGATHYFWDFNNESMHKAQLTNKEKYSKEEASKILEQLKKDLVQPAVYMPICCDLD